MIKEAICKLEELVRQAAAPLKMSISPREDLLMWSDGRQAAVTRKRTGMHRVAGSLDSFLGMVAEFGDESATTITVRPGTVVAVLNDDRESLEWQLDQIELIVRNSAFFDTFPFGKGLSQKQLLQWLRGSCTCTAAASLATAIRQVQWSRRSDGTATIERGKESLGRSVENKIQGTAEIPESLVFSESLIDLPGFVSTAQVTVLIDVDADEQVFRLSWAPGEGQLWTVRWQTELAETLAKETKCSAFVASIVS